MKFLNIFKNVNFYLSLFLVLFLNACQAPTKTSVTSVSTVEAFSAVNAADGAFYETLPDQVDQDSKINALILQARYYAINKQFDKAQASIDEMVKNITTSLHEHETAIVRGNVANLQGQNEVALNYLSKVNELILPDQVAVFYYRLYAKVNTELLAANKNDLYYNNAFGAYKSLIPLLSHDQAQVIAREALKFIQDNKTQSQISILLSRSKDFNDAGFYQYAIIEQTQNRAVKQRLLNDFHANYENHILATLYDTPDEKAGVTEKPVTVDPGMALQNGDKIAVLLPQSGRFKDIVGEPTKLGILAAIQDKNANLDVVFYDTNQKNIQDVVATLANDGTKFIIGPILKPEVDALIASSNKLPAIVFNTTDMAMPDNMFYFDLGPNFEGMIVANKIANDGHRNVLIIQGGSDRQKRTYDGFRQQITQRNLTLNTCTFVDLKTVKADLRGCDVVSPDAIYINATAMEANAVKEMIASDKDVYLSNGSYAGVNNSGIEMSMQGAIYGDMPWLLSESELKNAFFENIPKADSQVQRVFASGYDSINVAFNLLRLQQGQDNIIHGLSGDITLHGNLIYNDPLWIRLGTPR